MLAVSRFEPVEALAHLRRALAIYQAKLGSEHPYVASAQDHIASRLVELDRVDEAQEVLSRVLSLRRSLYGPWTAAPQRGTNAHQPGARRIP